MMLVHGYVSYELPQMKWPRPLEIMSMVRFYRIRIPMCLVVITIRLYSIHLSIPVHPMFLIKGADLIRLHRRATSSFSALSDKDLRKDEDNIFELWLSYAQVQASYGSAEDARLTFRHIQNQNLGVSKATFYLKFAEFEWQYDSSRAIQILKAGIEQNAEPQQLLYEAVKEIEASSRPNSEARFKPEQKSRDSKSTSPIPKLPSGSTLQSKKRKSKSETSPKRLKKNDGTAEVIMQVGSECSHPRASLKAVHRSNEKVSFAEGTAVEPSLTTGGDIVGIKTPTRPQLTSATGRPAFGSVSVLKSSQKKHSLITKTPRLSRVGLSGKPMRVNADDNPATDSDSSMDTATQSETIDAKALLENIADSMDITSKKPAPKISKMDLSYMLNWDPNSRQPPSSAASKNDRNNVDAKDDDRQRESNKERMPSMETVEEGSSNASAASLVTSTLTSVHSNATKTSHSHQTQHSHRSDGSNESNHAIASSESNASRQPATVEATASLDQTAILVAKSNPDFLPLVSEDNILRVNNVPYAKLGVIGKGGSCKVYRALAKDCSILAIKKVKLSGMDKKAINGYANEIALLKRLRGNPSIIQMYDSEVDLSRKAIFVAMELGEVDLNQVIQQQTLGGTKNGQMTSRSALEMNFIRLTWQQMLKAVHSIHEERIIHGDLKPANFLFVRGALKLIDFGIAKAIQSDDTTNIYRDSQIGTLNYMSPEAILDTGSGSNGARMRIGRVSLLSWDEPRYGSLLFFTNSMFALLLRHLIFGLLAVSSTKWSMVERHLQIST